MYTHTVSQQQKKNRKKEREKIRDVDRTLSAKMPYLYMYKVHIYTVHSGARRVNDLYQTSLRTLLLHYVQCYYYSNSRVMYSRRVMYMSLERER